MQRIQLTEKQIEDAVKRVTEKLKMRLEQKGYGTFASRHEILGVITEEYREFAEAVHSKNIENMKEEIIDLAVGSII